MRFKCKPADFRGYNLQPGDRIEVTYPVSYTYNGGIGIDGTWYEGYEVPAPILNVDHAIVGIGVGYELNARPPLATGVLKLKSDVKDQPYLDCDGIWKRDKIGGVCV